MAPTQAILGISQPLPPRTLVLRTVFWLTLTVARRTSHEIDPEKLSGWRLLDNFRARLERLAARFVLHPSFAAAVVKPSLSRNVQ